jgi:uncharacterized linocin/CFP29 family protein
MTDTTLQAFGKALDKQMVEPLRRVLIGRQLVPITPPAGFGASAVEWSTITEMSDGIASYGFTTPNEDTLGFTQTNKKIPFYWKDYRIDRAMYENFKRSGVNVDASIALSAGYKAGKIEDSTIIIGMTNDGTTYEVDGLYSGAGSTQAGSDFATAGYPTSTIAAAFGTLEAADVPTNLPMNLVLNPTQRNQLRGLRSATSGLREEPEVVEMLNGGKIFSTNALTAGTGLLLPAKEVLAPYVDLFLRVDWKNELGMQSEHPTTGDIIGRVYSGGILRLKQNTAVCTLTGI